MKARGVARFLHNKQEPWAANRALAGPDDAVQLAEEGAAPADAEEIWNALLDEESTPTDEEVFAYIDELRPTDEAVVPLSDFQKRAETLADGFTAAQLHAYIQKHRQPISQAGVYQWEVQRQPWFPDVSLDEMPNASRTKIAGTPPSLLMRGYLKASMTNKEKVVLQLMRECWGISVRELMDAPGQLDITVKEVDFELLAAGAQTWLQDISTSFSTVTTTTATASRSRSRSHSRSQTRQHRHIELLPDQHILRISAPAATADAILADINTMLSRKSTQRFKLSDIMPSETTLDAHSLKAVGALTGSCVRLSEQVDGEKSTADILVSWVQSVDRNKHHENTGDVVFRLLLRAYGSVARSRNSTAVDYWPMRTSKAQFLPADDETAREKWSWEHRLSSWARWVEPTQSNSLSSASASRSRSYTEEPTSKSIFFEFVTPDSTSSAETSNEADGKTIHGDDTSTKNKKWYSLVRTSTVATIGHVLHAQSTPGTTLLRALTDGPGARPSLPDAERILSPVVPPLLGMNLLSDPAAASDTSAAKIQTAATAPAVMSTAVLMRFLPHPKTPLAHCAPPLEVFLDASPSTTGDSTAASRPAFTELRTIMATHDCDVLFPAEPVDVRIAQNRFYALTAADILTMTAAHQAAEPAGIEPLLAFLEESSLQLENGREALATPPELPKLGLPGRVLLPVGEGARLREHAWKRHKTMPIDYVFAGLETRRRVATAFEGWTLALTSIDAGRGGGWRTELALEAVPAVAGDRSSNGHSDHNHSKSTFRGAVRQLVCGDKAKWLMQHREITC